MRADVDEHGAVEAAHERRHRANAAVDAHQGKTVVDIQHDRPASRHIVLIETAQQPDRVAAECKASRLRRIA